MKIPNYIIKKIAKHNSLLFQAAKIENDLDNWYDKHLSKKAIKAATFSDEDFADIKCDLTVTYISADNLQYNLDLLYSKP